MNRDELRRTFPNMSEDTLALNADPSQGEPGETAVIKQGEKLTTREKTALAADLTLPVLEETPDRLIIRLHGERPFTWNWYTTSVNPMARRAEFRRVKDLVQLTLFNEGYSKRPFSEKVGIEFRAYMIHPVYDPDNAAGKPYVDALQGFVITKDDLRYVRAVLPLVIKVSTAPRVELHIGPNLPWLAHFQEI